MKKDTLSDAVKRIESVEIQGAKSIAVFSLKFLKRISEEHGFGKEFIKAAETLERARPTAAVLHNCIERIKKEKTAESIDMLLEKLEGSDRKISENGLKLLKKKDYNILTHCHSSEVISLIKCLKKNKKKISVVATQTDPLEQGVKTAREISRYKIPTTLIIDSAAGYYMPEIDLVMVGTDAMRKEGVVNKIGTKLYLMAAKYYKKPVYVVGNTLKLDKRIAFEIEKRPESEIYKELSKPYDLKGIEIANPAFDVTPWEFVSKVITDEGVYTPGQIRRMLE